MRRLRAMLLAAGLPAMAGCVPPRLDAPAASRVAPPAAWRTATNPVAPIEARWWRSFHDPALTALVERALARNTDVLTAVARIDEARAQTALARASLFPMLQADGGFAAQRSLGTTGVATSRSSQPELDLSWEIDVFGRIRSLTRAARLAYVASQADRDATALEVAASTAQAYVTLLSLDVQLDVTRETLVSRERALHLAEDQARFGYSSRFELTQAQSEYQSVAVVIPQLVLQIAEQENAVRLLAGDLPGDVARRHGAFVDLKPPAVPGTLPSSLLGRRPDIEAAALRLAGADATMAARRAQFLPTVQISGAVGALFIDALRYDPVSVWTIGGSILAPLFTGGALTAQLGVATAQRDEAAYAYRAAVLSAFGEVENALASVASYDRQIASLRERRSILLDSLGMAQDRYQGGYASYLDVLDAERNLFSVELSAITVREAQLNNAVTLYRALGGGWSADGLSGRLDAAVGERAAPAIR